MKIEFSKMLLLLETALVLYTTYRTLNVVELAVNNGFDGTLPYLVTLITSVWAAYGASAGFYYTKSKAENVIKLSREDSHI